ncbi:MAG: DUF4293 family protein [Bacteroidales bacterium]|nr:DUF4293 family protein [Bacteroidales bacterium]
MKKTRFHLQYPLMIAAGLLMLSTLACEMCYGLDEEGLRESIRFTDRSQFMIFSFVTFSLTIVAAASSKKRLLQARICLLDSIMLLFYQIWIGVWFFRLHQVYTFTVAAIFPLIAAILLGVAISFILRDEARFMASNAAALHKH